MKNNKNNTSQQQHCNCGPKNPRIKDMTLASYIVDKKIGAETTNQNSEAPLSSKNMSKGNQYNGYQQAGYSYSNNLNYGKQHYQQRYENQQKYGNYRGGFQNSQHPSGNQHQKQQNNSLQFKREKDSGRGRATSNTCESFLMKCILYYTPDGKKMQKEGKTNHCYFDQERGGFYYSFDGAQGWMKCSSDTVQKLMKILETSRIANADVYQKKQEAYEKQNEEHRQLPEPWGPAFPSEIWQKTHLDEQTLQALNNFKNYGRQNRGMTYDAATDGYRYTNSSAEVWRRRHPTDRVTSTCLSRSSFMMPLMSNTSPVQAPLFEEQSMSALLANTHLTGSLPVVPNVRSLSLSGTNANHFLPASQSAPLDICRHCRPMMEARCCWSIEKHEQEKERERQMSSVLPNGTSKIVGHHRRGGSGDLSVAYNSASLATVNSSMTDSPPPSGYYPHNNSSPVSSQQTLVQKMYSTESQSSRSITPSTDNNGDSYVENHRRQQSTATSTEGAIEFLELNNSEKDDKENDYKWMVNDDDLQIPGQRNVLKPFQQLEQNELSGLLGSDLYSMIEDLCDKPYYDENVSSYDQLQSNTTDNTVQQGHYTLFGLGDKDFYPMVI